MNERRLVVVASSKPAVPLSATSGPSEGHPDPAIVGRGAGINAQATGQNLWAEVLVVFIAWSKDGRDPVSNYA
jgi:hypothetical protein